MRQYEDGKSVSLPCGHAYVRDGEAVVEEKRMMDKLTDGLVEDDHQCSGDLMLDYMAGLTSFLEGFTKPHEISGTLVEIEKHPELGHVSGTANMLFDAVLSVKYGK